MTPRQLLSSPLLPRASLRSRARAVGRGGGQKSAQIDVLLRPCSLCLAQSCHLRCARRWSDRKARLSASYLIVFSFRPQSSGGLRISQKSHIIFEKKKRRPVCRALRSQRLRRYAVIRLGGKRSVDAAPLPSFAFLRQKKTPFL